MTETASAKGYSKSPLSDKGAADLDRVEQRLADLRAQMADVLNERSVIVADLLDSGTSVHPISERLVKVFPDVSTQQGVSAKCTYGLGLVGRTLGFGGGTSCVAG